MEINFTYKTCEGETHVLHVECPIECSFTITDTRLAQVNRSVEFTKDRTEFSIEALPAP